MRKIPFILALLPSIIFGQVINLSPDSTSWDLHILPPQAGVPLDSLATFTVQPHADDTAIVTAVDFDANATNYQLRYFQGLFFPTISTGTQVLSNAVSADFQGLKVKIDVPSDNTNYAFRLFSTGADTVFNSDTVQLDMIPSPYDSTKFYVSNTGNDSNT